jgi:hypothetical protein
MLKNATIRHFHIFANIITQKLIRVIYFLGVLYDEYYFETKLDCPRNCKASKLV